MRGTMPVITDLLFAPPEQPAPQATAEPAEIVIVIDGKAVAKGRPRTAVIGGHARIFTPAKTRAYEAHGRLAAQVAMAGRAPLEGPVTCRITAVLPIPQSMPKRKRAEAIAGTLRPATRPDVDNYAKAGMDAINTIVVRDDSQVVTLLASKRYGDDPRLEIRVRPL